MADIWMDVDTALSEVPINLLPLTDDTDFKTREVALTYNQAGMDLVWNFVTTGGAVTQTAVIPTTGGVYDWAHQGDGMYSIEIPASGGVSINNDTEGFGWFTGYCTGVLPWRGPVIGFRAAGLNNLLIDSAYSATRGLGGTALPNAAADAAGGLPISDAGGLDIDTKLANTNEVTAARMGALTDWINGGRLDLILDELTTQGDTNEGKIDTNKSELDGLQGTDGKALISTDSQDLSASLDVSTKTLNRVAQSLTDLKDFADTGYDPVTHKVQGVVLADTCTTLTGHTPQTGDSYTIVNGDHGLVSIQDDIDMILADTGTTLENHLTDIKGTGFVKDTDSLPQCLTATSVTVSDKTGFSLSTAGIAAIWNALTSGMSTAGSIGKKLADWVVGTIDTYTGNTKQTADHTAAIADIPTVAEFEARTIAAADYLVEGDTLARVTLVDTVTANTDLVTAAAVKTAMEAAGSDLDYLIKALVNKIIITEASGNTEMFNDASSTLGTVTAAFTSDGTYTTRKRMVI